MSYDLTKEERVEIAKRIVQEEKDKGMFPYEDVRT